MESNLDYAKEIVAKILTTENFFAGDIPFKKLQEIAKNKGYSSIGSKKALDFLINRPFNMDIAGGIYFYKLDEVDKKGGMAIKENFVFPIKTKGGIVYVTSYNNDKLSHKNTYVCFTAHFFDRYAQRKHNVSRKQAVKEVFKNILENTGMVGNRDIFFENGVGLGESFSNDVIKVSIFKTYYSHDMIKPNQLKLLKNSIDELKTSGKLESDAVLNLINDLIESDNGLENK